VNNLYEGLRSTVVVARWALGELAAQELHFSGGAVEGPSIRVEFETGAGGAPVLIDESHHHFARRSTPTRWRHVKANGVLRKALRDRIIPKQKPT
jgi:hypothetical protein